MPGHAYISVCVCACVGVLAYGQMRLFVCVVILGMKRRTAKDGGKEGCRGRRERGRKMFSAVCACAFGAFSVFMMNTCVCGLPERGSMGA